MWQPDNSMRYYGRPMPENDANKEALEHVEKATESEPVSGEDLLESKDLKRQLREAKNELKDERRPAN